MPLIVPVLRLSMVFLNVWETFKTLKKPPPSARYGGQPSVRALSQRKRDMKGCLTVWIVWTCLTLYERLVERIISIFIPFYDEIKTLTLVFLILTRAKSSEPIFLHLIRPVLKPYTPTLDTILDLTCMFGDIAFLIITVPIRQVQAWWKKWKTVDTDLLESEAEGHSRSLADRHKSKSKRASDPGYPPPAYSAAVDNEWRAYPEFPSAYPPTPIVPLGKSLAHGAPSDIYIPPTIPEGLPEEPTTPIREDLPTFCIHPPIDDSLPADDDSDVEVDETLNITMQTPIPNRFRQTTKLDLSNATPVPGPISAVSNYSHRTGLSTNHTASSLCTRSSSESSSESDVSSDFSRDRSHGRNYPRAIPNRARTYDGEEYDEEEPIPRRRRTTIKPTTRRPTNLGPVEDADQVYSTTEDEIDEDVIDGHNADPKRRKAGQTSYPAKTHATRPVATTRASRLRASAIKRTNSASTDNSLPRNSRPLSTM